MELSCLEKYTVKNTVITSRLDPNLLQDDRVLESLLSFEEHFLPRVSYFKCVQTEVKPYMRSMLTDWMLEVCERKCEDGVFTLAVNYLDRFLAVVPTRKGHLQLLGAVCLFLASKLKEARRLAPVELCAFTDNAIKPDALLQWELLVVDKLNWDLAAVVPNDFIEPIVAKLPLPGDKLPLIRKHVQAVVALCATEFSFTAYPPSMMAAATIGAVIRKLQLDSTDPARSADNPLDLLAKMIHTETDRLKACQEQIERFLVTGLQEGRWSHKRAGEGADTEGPDPPAPVLCPH